MKRLVIALGLVSSVAFAKDAYMENHATASHDCSKAPEAMITGNENTITFTGTCTSIAVMGNQNKITVASTAKLSVMGNENTIDVHAIGHLRTTGNKNTVSWTKALSGDKPGMRNTGKDNKITQSK
jgi:hypothetical protein